MSSWSCRTSYANRCSPLAPDRNAFQTWRWPRFQECRRSFDWLIANCSCILKGISCNKHLCRLCGSFLALKQVSFSFMTRLLPPYPPTRKAQAMHQNCEVHRYCLAFSEGSKTSTTSCVFHRRRRFLSARLLCCLDTCGLFHTLCLERDHLWSPFFRSEFRMKLTPMRIYSKMSSSFGKRWQCFRTTWTLPCACFCREILTCFTNGDLRFTN